MANFSDNNFNFKEIGSSPKKDFSSFRSSGVVRGPERSNRRKKSKKKLKYFLVTFFLFFIALGSYAFYKADSTLSQITGEDNSLFKSIVTMIPLGGNFFQVLPVEGEEESPVDKVKNNDLDRLNILLLGLRGVGDPNGGLLTDTIIVASLKVDTGELALISIPRDFYVDIPEVGHKGKINEAYADGMGGVGDWESGLAYSKEAVENVTGLDIHYAASFDFEAFKEIIDILGGVTIYLDEPFSEKYQFEEGAIELPAGKNIIDGQTALLYVRARFSSNDFDRARRQQQVLVGIKEKAMGLGILSNPVKVISLMSALGNHVRTDAELWEIKDLIGIFSNVNTDNIRRKVFDTTEDGLLYQTYSSAGAYILLPDGDNYDQVHEACRNIFEF